MILSFSDIRVGMFALLAISAALVITELLARKKILAQELARKMLHVAAIGSCAGAIHSFENRQLLAFVFLFFTLLLWYVTRKGWLSTNNQRSYGIVFFPPAFALLLFAEAIPTKAIVYSALVLAFCDAAAGLTGRYLPVKKNPFLFEEKSWAGFGVFWFCCTVVTFFVLDAANPEAWLLCAVFSLLPALTELFSYKGSDNFTIPVITAIWICLLLALPVSVPGEHDAYLDIFGSGSLPEFYGATGLMIMFGFIAVYKKWLTQGGAAAALWMGFLILVCCGWRGFIAPGLFLVSGSLLSKLNKQPGEKLGRNAKQVFANGITGIICMMVYALFYRQEFLYASIASFAVGICDSVGSEAGRYFKGRTVDILSLRKTTPGLSGGISLPGTVAGLAGAALLAGVVCGAYGFSLPVFFEIVVAGFMGMLADSVLGSVLQRKYQLPGGNIVEDAVPGAVLIKGVEWCNNDVVNLLSVFITTAIFILCAVFG